MRRAVVCALAIVTAFLGTVPASASAPKSAPGPVAAKVARALEAAGGWEPAPSAPWDVPAGARCDFPVHGEPVVDEVVQRVLTSHPDGSPKQVAYKGDLVIRITNTDTGSTYDADASGSALVEYGTDGSQFWYVLGPVLVGFAEGGGNMPRSLYLIDGVYTLDISSDGYKSVDTRSGTTTTDLCARVA